MSKNWLSTSAQEIDDYVIALDRTEELKKCSDEKLILITLRYLVLHCSKFPNPEGTALTEELSRRVDD